MADLSEDDAAAARADGGSIISRFGALLRRRRLALGMNQSDLALATGVGRRFIIDLEAGKPSCQIGKALLVAASLGVRVVDLIEQSHVARLGSSVSTDLQLNATESPDEASISIDDLPDFPDDIEEPGP